MEELGFQQEMRTRRVFKCAWISERYTSFFSVPAEWRFPVSIDGSILLFIAASYLGNSGDNALLAMGEADFSSELGKLRWFSTPEREAATRAFTKRCVLVGFSTHRGRRHADRGSLTRAPAAPLKRRAADTSLRAQSSRPQKMPRDDKIAGLRPQVRDSNQTS